MNNVRDHLIGQSISFIDHHRMCIILVNHLVENRFLFLQWLVFLILVFFWESMRASPVSHVQGQDREILA